MKNPAARAPVSFRGFSLIELLVVLFIIGLLVGTVSLSLNTGQEPEERLEREARRLLEFSGLAGERAVLTGEPVGLVLLPPASSREGEPAWRYRWERYRAGEWTEAEAPLASRRFPANIELSLEVEGEQVNLIALANDEDDSPQPSVVFYPGGEITPFQLTLFYGDAVDRQQVLTSEGTGVVEILEEDEVTF